MMMFFLEGLLGPLDRARAAVLQRAAAVPSLRAWLAPRDRRVAALASAGIVVAFALSILAPAALYALSPIVVGVPHLASDARYLLLRADFSTGASRRRVLVAAAVWCAALVAVRAAELAGVPSTTTARIELGLAAAGILATVAVAGRGLRALVVAGITLALLVAALSEPRLSRVVLAHAHNLVAVILWLALWRGSRRALALPLGLLAVATALIASGATFGPVITLGSHHALGVELLAVADHLAPSLTSAAVPLTLAYVFLQQIHYAAWLGWIPQGALRPTGSLTFRQSWRALLRDLGPTGVGLTVAAMLALALAAVLGPLARTRDLYLFVTGVHAYVELAALAWLAVRPTSGVR